MADVVIRMEREEAEALLVYGHPLKPSAVEKLRAALDSPPVEERLAVQIVGENLKEDWPPVEPAEDFGERLSAARERTALLRNWFAHVRIQQRTITTFSDGSSFIGPWSDLEGEGGDRG